MSASTPNTTSQFLSRVHANEHLLFILLSNSSFTLQDITGLQSTCRKLKRLIRNSVFIWAMRADSIRCKLCAERNKQAMQDFLAVNCLPCDYWRGVCYREAASNRLRACWNTQFASRSLVNTVDSLSLSLSLSFSLKSIMTDS